MISTHPIAGEVANTEQASTIFDGITYDKGASTVKCLHSVVGHETLGKAMNQYFTKFAFRNTTFSDLVDCLQKNTSYDMHTWGDQWIRKAGHNYLKPEYKYNENSQQFESFFLRQGNVVKNREDCRTLRHHTMKLAFFDGSGRCYLEKVVNIKNQEKTQIDVLNASGAGNEVKTHQGFKAVLLNYEDLDFVRVLMDKQSQKWFTDNLEKIEDEFSRAVVIRSLLFSMSYDRITITDFESIFERALYMKNSVSTHS